MTTPSLPSARALTPFQRAVLRRFVQGISANPSPELRLFAVTGFLGGLTTFSTFSAEVVELLMRGDLAAGALLASAHLAGSLALTFAGFATYRALAG